MAGKPVTVVGAYCVGLYFLGDRLPGPGETVIGSRFYEGPGGKGSNQAVAALKLGAPTRFIARVGRDAYGEKALAMYRGFGLDTDLIAIDEGSHTGIGAILVDQSGRNLISVVPGANGRLSPQDIDAAEAAIADSCIVGCQLETPLEIADYALRKAHRLGVTTLLDPAPAAKLPEDLYGCLDFIKPNESEAALLTGIPVDGVASALEAGRWFVARGVRNAIITLGDKGAVLVTANTVQHFPAVPVEPFDTTGAGDVFSGALMAAWHEGRPIDDCIRFATHAAALSVTRLGVIESIPDREEVLASIRRSAESPRTRDKTADERG
jgi:ribokinase